MPFLSNRRLKQIKKNQKLRAQEILMYQRVMEGMRTGLKMDALLKLIVDSVREGLGFVRAGIFLMEPDGKHVRLALGVDKNLKFERNKERIPVHFKRGANHFSDVVNGHKKYFYSNHIPTRLPKQDWDNMRVQVYNNALVPLQVGKGRAIGALAVDNLDKDRPITPEDMASLMNYATQVGLALQSLRTHEKLVLQSLTDPLTGLHNRRFFEHTLDQELRRCQRYGRAFSLVLADIDRFKRVNDVFGHDSGDEVLKQVSGLIRDSLRSMDMVTRIGGEEFGVILPETPPNSIAVVTQRLLRNVREAQPPVSEMVVRRHRTTVSLGVASFRKGDQVTPEKIFKLADQSLYLAKQGGRNRCGPLEIIRS